MTPEHGEPRELETLRTQEPGVALVYGDALLRMERLGDEVVLGWVSTMDPIDFLERVALEPGSADVIFSPRSAEISSVGPEVAVNPQELSAQQSEGIQLIRIDFERISIVWERASDNYSDISVVADSWARAEGYLARFIPARDFETVPLRVAEYAAS